MIAAAVVNFSLYSVRNQRLDAWDPVVFSIALAAGIAATVVVSLITPPEPFERLRSFFVRVNTPSGGSETEPLPMNADLAVAARQGRQLLVVNLLRLRKASAGFGWRAYRTDLKGFVIGWAIVIALVFSTWLLFRY
jgi:hypothetical protein